MAAAILGPGRAALPQRRRREPAVRRRRGAAGGAARARGSGCRGATRSRCRTSSPGASPRALLLGNLFRDQLDRYGELELVAERWRALVARLDAARRASSSCADDPLSATSRDARDGRAARTASTIRASRRDAVEDAADSRSACAAAPLRLRGRLSSRTSATTAARGAATPARRSTSRARDRAAGRRRRSPSAGRAGGPARSRSACRACTTSRTPSGGLSLAYALGVPTATGAGGWPASVRRSAASSGSRRRP